MNIFILDKDPIKAAQLQCDRHIVKMVLESAQLLSTAHRVLDNDNVPADIYRATHKNHPCAIWARESSENYEWLYNHFIALCNEYTYRYGRTHTTHEKLGNVLKQLPKHIKRGKRTPFALAMRTVTPELIDESNPVKSYQRFYNTKQNKFKMTWTKRSVPDWFKAHKNNN